MKALHKSQRAWLIYAAGSLLTFGVGALIIELRYRYALSQPSQDDILEHFGDWIVAVLSFACVLIPLLMAEFEVFLILRRRFVQKTGSLGLERVFSIVCCSLAALSLVALPLSIAVMPLARGVYDLPMYGLCGSLGATLLWLLIRLTLGISTAVTALVLRSRDRKSATSSKT